MENLRKPTAMRRPIAGNTRPRRPRLGVPINAMTDGFGVRIRDTISVVVDT
jgi:hypothetical protein